MSIYNLSLIAALLFGAEAVALITLHFLPTGYIPTRDAVSDYGVGQYRGWFWAHAITGGLGCLLLGAALLQLHPYTPTSAAIALIVTAVARFLIPFFATDLGGNRFQTTHGRIHMLLAYVAFGGIIWAATGVGSTLSHYPAWHSLLGTLTALTWGMIASVVGLIIAIRGRHFSALLGVFERWFYLFSIGWLLLVAINLVRIEG